MGCVHMLPPRAPGTAGQERSVCWAYPLWHFCRLPHPFKPAAPGHGRCEPDHMISASQVRESAPASLGQLPPALDLHWPQSGI